MKKECAEVLGFGTVGRAVAFDTRDPQFESSHHLVIILHPIPTYFCNFTNTTANHDTSFHLFIDRRLTDS